MINDFFCGNFPFKFWYTLDFTLTMSIAYGLMEMIRDHHTANGVQRHEFDRVLRSDSVYKSMQNITCRLVEIEIELKAAA